jgi:DNA-binding NarL/FixJ family response regulator
MTQGTPARVLIAVEGELVRRALVEMVREMPEFALRGAVGDAAAVRLVLRSRRVDVLVLDMLLADKLNAAFAEFAGHPRVVLVSPRRHMGLDGPCAVDCACGFVRERAPLRHIETALRLVAVCDIAHAGDDPRCRTCPLRPTLQPAPLPLTVREQSVFAHIGAGASNQGIAMALGVSVKTVECHRENIKRKLGLDSGARLAAAAVAWRLGEFVVDHDALALRETMPKAGLPRRRGKSPR